MFYLIGLGLDLESVSKEAIEICKRADRVYVENYTIEFPYKIEKIEGVIGKNIFPLTRVIIEREKFVDAAKKKDIVLLVYGSPLIATTHVSLIMKCIKEGIEHKVLHNASIFDAIGETGLQIYKFGKTASMPKWTEKHKPKSFVDLILENQKINAHSLLLVDIGLTFPDALNQLIKACGRKIKLKKIIVCSQLGTKDSRIYYATPGELHGAEVFTPFCFIIPGEMHFMEEEVIEKVKEKI